MTTYRTIHDGYCEWLQYQSTEFSGWWIFKKLRTTWRYIRTDHYDYFDEQWEKWERKYHFSSGLRDYNRYINSYNTDLALFTKLYPLIETWHLKRRESIKEQRRIAHNRMKQVDVRKGQIRPLT